MESYSEFLLGRQLTPQTVLAPIRHWRHASATPPLHHSDRGVEYSCEEYQALLAHHGITCSMSRRGNCYDNAVVENFLGALQTELIHHHTYTTRNQARLDLFEYSKCLTTVNVVTPLR